MARLPAVLVWLFYRAPAPGWKRHAVGALMAALVLAVGVTRCDLFGQAAGTPLRLDPHTRTSLHQALVLSFCGRYGAVDPRFSYDDAALDAELLGTREAHVPYSQLIAARHGSLERYCAQEFRRFLNNENGLFLAMAALLRFPPDDTPRLLAVKLTAFACALLFAALAMLAALGAGILPLLFVGVVASRAVELVQQTHLLSSYSIMPVLLLVSGAAIALLVPVAERARAAAIVAAALGFGLMAALIYNFRTSYGLAAAGQLVVALAILGVRRRNLARAGTVLACAAAGFIAFQAALIWPLERGASFNEASHGIWHPLVIGLAIPPTPFTQREGIEWDDRVAYALAKRVDPGVQYLGPGYEAALRTYYVQLWRDHPSEMARLYWRKLHELGWTTKGLVHTFFQSDALTEKFERIVPGGVQWLACVLATALLMVFGFSVYPPVALAGIGFAAAALYVSLEQAAVTSAFVMTYQAALVVLAAASLAMLSVLAAAAVAARLRRTPAGAPLHAMTSPQP
jgi:hypothetical protein